MSVAFAVPAAAAVRIATYSGSMSQGYDETGIFGAADSDLAGRPFVARYRYDLQTGTRQTDPGIFDVVFDDKAAGRGLSLTATLTIGTVTENFGCNSGCNAFVENIATQHFLQDNSSTAESVVGKILTSFAYSAFAAPSLDSLFDLTPAAGEGGFVIFETSDGPGDPMRRLASGEFRVESFSVSADVPEPSTWAYLIIGFAAVGCARRRRSPPVVHA